MLILTPYPRAKTLIQPEKPLKEMPEQNTVYLDNEILDDSEKSTEYNNTQ